MFDRDLSRRDALKLAVATGGATALSACLSEAEEPVPRGSPSAELPEGQHRWNDFLNTDDAGNHELPPHHVFLSLALDGDGPPTEDDRAAVESAMGTLDRAYQWSHAGLLSSLAYTPAYFGRFDADLAYPLPDPRRLSSFETPEFDTQDALLHLASDRPDALLEAEQALLGEREEMNGLEVETSLSAVFSVTLRRTGFIGAGMPAERQGEVKGIPSGGPVPEESPLFMGFKAGFRGNQATESAVNIQEGPFAGGTTKHLATIRQRLDDWYGEQDFEERVMEMFSPLHAERGLVEGVGNDLGDFSGVDEEVVETIREQARNFGRVGHAQKAARANRDADGEPLLLRRHVESTDDGEASLHFPSLQRNIESFEAVREAMNGADLTDIPTIRQRVNNGILEYIFVTRRGNYLVPPRSLRALPTPTGT
ncbi:Tat pathway signal protein [Salinigranum rubrum]|uniref:Tat pathway signal protein n=1 Tax=Salinigranum rubrum TaxID=755307 RepID=A0A2I8VI41_9EURY|nr:twin-arginine translocation signal domain-containing protein [Salinigranum rubrum]AUV81580.1 Tat pathway signal protein [Salinigranum rubrum]